MSPTSYCGVPSTLYSQKYIVWTGDWKSPPILKEPTPDTFTSTLSDSDDITDEISTYWFGANVYVCEFPVAGSITVMVTVFGDKFSRYISADGEELDDEDEELLFCELTP